MQSRNIPSPRWVLTVFAGAAFLTVFLLGFANPVSAKGPESVTITGPGIIEPLELMEAGNFDRIAKLMEQTGLWYGTGDLPHAIDPPAGELGPAYTLTWINSGPPGDSVEQRTMVQYLYLDAERGILIHTPDQKSLENWGHGVIGWFTAPAGLPDTLSGLGVPVEAAQDTQTTSPLMVIGIAGFALAVMVAGALGIRRTVR
jgi:hypothetical protein